MKKLISLGLVALFVLGCGKINESINKDQVQTNMQLQQYQTVQPVPFYGYSEQRNTLIQIYNAKNQARQTWAVIQTITGVPTFSCESVGFPIPADTQLTAPDQIVTVYAGSSYVSDVVGQMEPDGLYTSGNTDATYVLCIRPNGKLSPIYTEQKVTMFPFEVKIVDGLIVDTQGAATIEIEVKGAAPTDAPSPSPAP